MEQKQIIDEAMIHKMSTHTTIGAVIAAGVLIFAAVCSFILFFGCLGFILALVFAVLAILILLHREKRGELQVYFVRRPVIRKYTMQCLNDEGDEYTRYMLAFDIAERGVLQHIFDKTVVGDEFFLMYDKYDNKISDLFSVNEYELAPNMELRQG